MIERFEPLYTPRLHLEPVTADVARSIAHDDVAALGAADGWPQPGTKAGIALAADRGHPPGWLVRLSGLVIGDCGIRAPVDDTGAVEIGYGLARPYQGQGLGTELVTAISDWLLAQPAVTMVRARTQPSNGASRGVLEKAGFTLANSTEDLVVFERAR